MCHKSPVQITISTMLKNGASSTLRISCNKMTFWHVYIWDSISSLSLSITKPTLRNLKIRKEKDTQPKLKVKLTYFSKSVEKLILAFSCIQSRGTWTISSVKCRKIRETRCKRLTKKYTKAMLVAAATRAGMKEQKKGKTMVGFRLRSSDSFSSSSSLSSS